eukprot:COSAG06_NODE_14653_length_1138_cov_2.868142_1_plen_122_part_10
MSKSIESNAVDVFVLSAIAGYTCEGDILDEVASKSIDEVDSTALTWDDTTALRFVFHLHTRNDNLPRQARDKRKEYLKEQSNQLSHRSGCRCYSGRQTGCRRTSRSTMPASSEGSADFAQSY